MIEQNTVTQQNGKGRMALSRKTLGKMTLGRMTLSRMTLLSAIRPNVMGRLNWFKFCKVQNA